MKHLVLAALLLTPSSLTAQASTDLAVVDRAVEGFTGLPIGLPGGAAQPLDRRMRLARCAGPLALSWYGARREAVQVQCPDTGSWRLFVPVLAGVAAPGGGEPAVLRGEAVTVTVAGEGFAVSQPGEAMDPGAVGAWIRVKVGGTNAQPLRAKVARPGLVIVDLGNDLP